MAFSLTKWYVDVVTEDGRVAIAYWAEVRAAGGRYAVCGLQLGGTGAAASDFSLRARHGPRLIGDRLVWYAKSLALDVSLLRLAPDVSHRFLDTPDGTADWTAWGPAADVYITVGEEVLHGAGYAERIDLTIAPWAVPLRTLNWGRFVAGNRSAIWISLEGPQPQTVAWLDGAPVAGASIAEESVTLGGAGRLTFADRATVTDATVGEQLTSLTTLGNLIDRVARSHQKRWRSRATLSVPGHPDVTGWAVHEHLRWR